MTLIYFILILGITVFVHEFGHFITAKKNKIYVYEFSLGMGKRLFSFKRKNDETEYNIRLLPIGGYVKLAGEENDDDQEVSDDQKLCNKKIWQRAIVMFCGAGFNFVFAIIVLFISALIFGSYNTKTILGSLEEDYPAYQAGLRQGDRILAVDSQSVSTFDDLLLFFTLNSGKEVTFTAVDTNNKQKEVTVKPTCTMENDTNKCIYGITQNQVKERGFVEAISYTYDKTISMFKSMFVVLKGLFTGQVGVSNLSGPVGIYNVVGESAKTGIDSLLYLLAFISVNVGVINLLPIPAFDGGRLLFLFIEKIRGKKISVKTENIIHTIGFAFLMLLMLYITVSDITKLF